MNDKYEVWMANAESYLIELERMLETKGDNEVLIAYKDISLAFPSRDPNPFYFETPRIDDQKFLEWAKAAGWSAELVLEPTENGVEIPTHIRFKKTD